MPLSSGSSGPEVVRLQQLLNTKLKPSPNLQGTGQFGPNTREAVLRFQRQMKLDVDGIVGPKTWAALGVGTFHQNDPIAITATNPSTWVGLGVKVGSHIAYFGADTLFAPVMMSLTHPGQDSFSLALTNVRWGPGGGFGVGLSLVVVQNLVTPSLLDGQVLKENDFQVTLGTKWSGALKVLSKAAQKFPKNVTDDLIKQWISNPKQLQTLLDWGKATKDAGEGVKKAMTGTKPVVTVLDIPGLGAGLELSKYERKGKVKAFNIQLNSAARGG